MYRQMIYSKACKMLLILHQYLPLLHSFFFWWEGRAFDCFVHMLTKMDRFMTVKYHLAVLVQRITGGDRKAYLKSAQNYYDQFLRLLDSYDVLSKSETALYEQFRNAPNDFSTAPANDFAKRRGVKITRFKQEKELKQKLEVSAIRFLYDISQCVSHITNLIVRYSTSKRTLQPSKMMMTLSETSTSPPSTLVSTKPSTLSTPSSRNYRSSPWPPRHHLPAPQIPIQPTTRVSATTGTPSHLNTLLVLTVPSHHLG